MIARRVLIRFASVAWLLAASAASAAAQPAVGLVGFGHFGYERLAAKESFETVLGSAGGGVFGGGAEVRVSGAFVNAAIERLERTGQRVLVIDGEVFKLGIANTITLRPITVTAGWRFVHEKATPYVGAGVGRITYREQSKFAEASENVDARFASYHVLGGVEFRNQWVATAFEVQYTRAPDTLGAGGASAAFHESNLGGVVGRVKVLVGR